MNRFDVIIVGAGPAGSTLARLLSKQMKVLLIHKSNSMKPCGGLLAPDTQKELAKFNLTLPKEVLVDPQIFSVKTVDLVTKQEKWYQRMYLNVDRVRFDDWLISLIPKVVQIVEGTCINVDEEKSLVYYSHQGNIAVAEGRYIVGADGAHSEVRKSIKHQLKTRTYIAIQQWFKLEEQQLAPCYSCIFDYETTNCCSWIIGKDGYLIYGGAFERSKGREQYELQKKRMDRVGISLEKPIRTEACEVLRPTGSGSFFTGRGTIYLVGEAAGFISPSSLEGISSAFISATKLAESILSQDKRGAIAVQRRYKNAVRFLKLKLILKNVKCIFMYHPKIRKWVLKSGITSMSVYENTF